MVVRSLFWIFLALLVRFLWRSLFREVFAPEGGSSGSRALPGIYKGLMVRDPVCGVHVPESASLVELRAGEAIHFCSEACRTKFRTSEAGA
jgi:YHS domain-containing protein